MRPIWIALLVVLIACSPPAGTPETTPSAQPAPTSRSAVAAVVRFAAVGDIGVGSDAQAGVGRAIADIHGAEPLDVVLLLGDLVYPDGAGHRFASRFREPWAPVYDAGIRLEAALGNHDIQTDGGAEMMEAFDMPGRYHAWTIGHVAFFALDSNDLDRQQLNWLDRGLEEADEPWKVLFLHHAPYSSGSAHGSNLGVREALAPLIREHGVQLVLAGHDHHYERTVPIADEGGVVHVVAGTGCCPRSVGRSRFTAFAASVPGALVADVSEDRMHLRFITTAGRVLDEAELEVGAPVPAGSR